MVDLDPGNRELRRTLAQTEVRAGNLDDALAVYTNLRDMDPDNLGYQPRSPASGCSKKTTHMRQSS